MLTKINRKTTIQLEVPVAIRLHKLKRWHETYSDVIRRLIKASK